MGTNVCVSHVVTSWSAHPLSEYSKVASAIGVDGDTKPCWGLSLDTRGWSKGDVGDNLFQEELGFYTALDHIKFLNMAGAGISNEAPPLTAVTLAYHDFLRERYSERSRFELDDGFDLGVE